MDRFTRTALPLAPLLAILAAGYITGGTGAAVVHAITALAILTAATSIGAVVVRRLRLPSLSPLERGIMAAVAGMGTMGLVIMGIGAAGGLHPAVVVGVTILLAGTAGIHTRAWHALPAAYAEIQELFRGPAGLALLIAAILSLAALLISSIIPVWEYDTLMYHLPIPREFVQERSILAPADQLQVAYVGLIHMLYVVTVAVGLPEAATVVSGLYGFLLLAAVFKMAARELPASAARLAVVGVAGSTIVAFVALTPRVDVTLALCLFLAHFSVLQSARGGSPRFLIAGALFSGIAVGAKLDAAAYLIPLVVWGIWLVLRKTVPARYLLLSVGAALVFIAPGLVKNWLLVGNPVHPLLMGPRLPLWLADDPRVQAIAAAETMNVLGPARDAVSLVKLLFQPESLSLEVEGRYFIWSPLLLVGLLVVLLTPNAWVWALPALVFIGMVLLHSLRTNLRYIIPALPALSVAAAVAIHSILRRWPAVRRWTIGALFALSLAPLAVPLGLVWAWVHDPIGSGRYDTIYAAASAASRHVPADGTILMLYEARAWPFERTVLQDNSFHVWPLLYESGHAQECLRDLDVTHVLINAGMANWIAERVGPSRSVPAGDALEDWISRCLVLEEAMQPHYLFRVKRGRP